MAAAAPLYLYMLTNRKPHAATSTQLGCVSNVEERAKIHNSKVPVAGSERRARQAAGWWKIVLVIVVPPSRNLSARALASQWKTSSRKIHRRFEQGVRIARDLDLLFFINTEEVRTDERITAHVPRLIDEMLRTVDDEYVVERAARTAHGKSPSSTVAFADFSFVKSGRPRKR